MDKKYSYQVRLTGILLKEDKILLVRQRVNKDRNWSLPGGRLEHGETMEEGIIREVKEETGLDVSVRKLLYLCDKLDSSPPIVHITFLLEWLDGEIILPTNEYDSNPISDVKFVDIGDLTNYGFSNTFKELLLKGLPDSGSYKGMKKNIGL